jgi:hypothetical protein
MLHWQYPSLLFPDFTRCVTRMTERVPLVKQELCTIPEHPIASSLRFFCWIRVVFCQLLCFCLFSFGDCIKCLSFDWLVITSCVSSNFSKWHFQERGSTTKFPWRLQLHWAKWFQIGTLLILFYSDPAIVM